MTFKINEHDKSKVDISAISIQDLIEMANILRDYMDSNETHLTGDARYIYLWARGIDLKTNQ